MLSFNCNPDFSSLPSKRRVAALAYVLFAATFGLANVGQATPDTVDKVDAANAVAASVPTCNTGTVSIGESSVCGLVQATESGKKADAFLGMPFAESTADRGRWRAPVAKAAWHGTLSATKFGPVCPQYAVPPDAAPNLVALAATQSEDCLTMNVWTRDGTPANAQLPVMVFIYGGSFVAGDSGYSLYDGAFLAANKNVILVSFNYRVGALGFLATDSLSGNYGFMDQQLALSWVRKNIRGFGGDPGKVTIFGESAGAMSVGLHVFSAPGSAKLFRAAIMESNFLALPYKSLADQVNVGNIYQHGLGCQDEKCLRATSVNDLLLAQNAFTPQMSDVFSGTKYYIPFSPAIDGTLLTRQPIAGADEGLGHKPLLIGTNKNEAVLFTEGKGLTPATYSANAASLFGRYFQAIIADYPLSQEKSIDAVWARVQTEGFLICSARHMASVASGVKTPVYAYLFNHQPSFKVWGGPACSSDDNVCHGAELPFVFHTADQTGGKFTPEEARLSEAIGDYWTNFAKYLNPNGPEKNHRDWPVFKRDARNYMVLNVPQLTVENDPYRASCALWERIGYNLVDPWAGSNSIEHAK
ncbi:carboxylesterase/lipase family protein [Glaciimonas sp. GNP009]